MGLYKYQIQGKNVIQISFGIRDGELVKVSEKKLSKNDSQYWETLAIKRNASFEEVVNAFKPKIQNRIHMTSAPRRTRQRGQASRSSAASGDSNPDSDDSDPERRPSLSLFDQAALADLLKISKKTLQNLYSSSPHTLPAAIQIPGARGPRWTPTAVQEWLNNRPPHTTKPIPQPIKKTVGRPRIAFVVKGGAA